MIVLLTRSSTSFRLAWEVGEGGGVVDALPMCDRERMPLA